VLCNAWTEYKFTCVCVCVSVTLSDNSPTGQTPQRIFTVNSETSWVVSYGGKTVPRWQTAAILNIDISPYLSEKSSDFDEILYTAADFALDERHAIKNEKVALDRLRV